MTDREDRIVPVCGCKGGPLCRTGICCACDQPITAINIDKMQRDLAAKDRVVNFVRGSIIQSIVNDSENRNRHPDGMPWWVGDVYLARLAAVLDAHDKEVGSE